MGNDVFANGREISCKAADGKAICAFPDVCMTPPENPATPPGVPVPYPNTGMAKDATKGSKKVQISKKEVMLKNKSHFKKSTGDEAGSAAKKGVVTSVNRGKIFFNSWSMDVKVEGKNVVRHLDLTTHNHNNPGQTPPWPYADSAAMTPEQKKACNKDKRKEKKACKGCKNRKEECENDDCQKAQKCQLVPYGESGSPNCCDGKTGHHLLPNSLLQGTRGDSSTNIPGLETTGDNAYNVNKGACVCVDGGSHSQGEHGELHKATKEKLRAILMSGKNLTYEDAKKNVAKAHTDTFKNEDESPQCEQKCLEAQIDNSLNKCSSGDGKAIRQKDGMTRKNFEKYLEED